MWNANACNGVVGAFNLQGASWDRRRRRFFGHDAAPPALTATVRVTDVETLRAALEEEGCRLAAVAAAALSGDGDGNGVAAEAAPGACGEWAAYASASGELHVLPWDGGVDVTLDGEWRARMEGGPLWHSSDDVAGMMEASCGMNLD